MKTKGNFLFQFYIISTWLNFPFITVFGAQLRFEFLSITFLIYYLFINRNFFGFSQSNNSAKFLPRSLIGFLIANIFSSTYYALIPLQSFWMLAQICNGIFVFYLIRRAYHKEILFKIASRISFIVAFFYLIYSALFFVEIIDDFMEMFNESSRFHGLSFESNILASQALFWIFVEILYKTQPHRNISIYLLVIVILLSQTRAAILCLVILLLAEVFRSALKAPIGLIQLILVISAFLLLATMNIDQISKRYDENSFQGRILRLVDVNSGTALYRQRVIDIAIEDIRNSRVQIQILGSGTNSFKQHHEIDISKVESGYISSLWVQILYDSGFIGLIFFIGFFFNLIRVNASRLFIAKTFYLSIFICASLTNMIWFAYLWISLAFFENFKKT